MAYHVQYGPPIPVQYQKKQKTMRLRILTAAWLLVFSMLVKGFFPDAAQKLQQLLIPGEPTVTQQALSGFTEDLRHGERVSDAFTAFCRQIISNDETIIH